MRTRVSLVNAAKEEAKQKAEEKREDAAVERAAIIKEKNDGGPNVYSTKDLGELVSYTSGEFKFQPRQFETITVGSLYIETRVREGEGHHDALRRIIDECERMQWAEFTKKLALYKRMSEEMCR